MSIIELTLRQQQILDFIIERTRASGSPPTRAEIASAFGFRSANAAEVHLRALTRKGAIEMAPGRSRGIRVVSMSEVGASVQRRQAMLPLIGQVAAGSPILVVIFCGVRSSEILQRVVRDVDAGGTRLLIPQAKTDAGKRAPELPAVIQPAVRARTRGRAGTEPLLRNALGVFPRSVWLLQNLKRYCQLAGVPVVCPHALRGGWASIAYSAGALSHTVAAALGHASPAVTEAHYARPEAVAGAKQAQRLKLLKGGRAG